MLCAKIGWNWPSGSGEEDFFMLVFFSYYLPLEKGVVRFDQTWIPITQWCFVPSLVKIGPVALETIAHYVNILSLLGKGRDPSWKNKPESSSPKDALCQIWLKLAKWFSRRFLIAIISPLKKGRVPSFEQTWRFPSPTQGCFLPSLVEIDPLVLRSQKLTWSFGGPGRWRIKQNWRVKDEKKSEEMADISD